MLYLKFLFSAIFLILIIKNSKAQENNLSANYIGFIPSILIESYDTIDALGINILPFLYEFRSGKKNELGFQIRPILNYRFFKTQNGVSQIGGTLVVNKYFLQIFAEDFWLKPQLGIFYTYTYNLLDMVQTMTLGLEPGVFMKISKSFSLSLNLQPGINYYPDKFSQDFVDAKKGIKSHFGFIFHTGFNF